MQSKKDNIPSSKVGLVFLVVVLIVVGTIFSSKIDIKKPIVDLESVELLVERKTGSEFKTGDTDNDGLSDWLEEFYNTDIKNADTDGDGTQDGEEVDLKRNPAVAGPDDKMIIAEDYFTKDYSSIDFATNTLTSKLSRDLFGQYLVGKKDGVLTEQEKTTLIDDISQKATKDFEVTDQFFSSQITSVQAIKESITAYGDVLAQENLSLLKQLDLQKDLPENEYLLTIGQIYKDSAISLSRINVPNTLVETHVKLINNTYNTGVLYIELAKSEQDTMTMLVLLSKQKVIQESTSNLYSMLAQYFKNNGIIFSMDTSVNFWTF
jgi:hypothetical protein